MSTLTNSFINGKTHKKREKRVIPTCQICIEPLNKSTRLLIQCPFCAYECCRSCCETYILNETGVKCMNPECAKQWSRKHIRERLTLVFINNRLKEHTEKILFDKERALLPATQPIVEGKLEAVKIQKEIHIAYDEISVIRKKIDELLLKKTRVLDRKPRAEARGFVRACPDEDCRGFLSSQWKCGICDKWTCPDCHIIKGFTRDSEHTCNEDDLATARLLASDTKPCPKCGTGIFKIDGCFAENTPILLWDGSIKMSQDICVGDNLVGDDGKKRTVLETTKGIDQLYEVMQTKGITYIVNSKHTLTLQQSNTIIDITVDDYMDLDDTVKRNLMGYKLISRDIPNDYLRTSIQVNKLEQGVYYGWQITDNHRFILPDFTVVKNCDQMWCTQCHTPFSWRTGNIEKSVHNPHYYEWMRRNGGLERNPQDVPCGRNLDHYLLESFSRILRTHYHKATNSKTISIRLNDIIRYAVHFIHVEQERQPNYERRNEDLRISYLMKEITEKEMRELLQRDDKRYHRKQELIEVYTLLTTTVTDILHRFADQLEKGRQEPAPETIDDSILAEIDTIVAYVNECLADISHTYSCAKVAIDRNLKIIRRPRVVPIEQS